MRVLVCGDREWTDYEAVLAALQQIARHVATCEKCCAADEKVVVIHGDNGVLDPHTHEVVKGADKMGGRAAESLGMEVQKYPADWATYGRAAGPIRNQQMINQGKPDFALVFHPDLSKSRGTKDMVGRLVKHGILYHHHRGNTTIEAEAHTNPNVM